MELSPIDFGDLEKGSQFNIVAKVIFFHAAHEYHIMQDVYTGKRFGFRGLIELGYMSHTILSAVFLKQYPYPKVGANDQMKILNHEIPTWQSLKGVIDVCSGIGAMAEGSLAAGFEPAISVDANERMTGLCEKSSLGMLHRGHW